MSFDNKYPNRKDNRRNYDYKYAKSVDRTCRNHGGCPHCEGNRQITSKKLEDKAEDMLKEQDD